MTRTLPLPTLEDGGVKARPARKKQSARVYAAPRFQLDPTPEQIARGRALFNGLSPRGKASAIRFIEMLAKDEAGEL